MGSAISSSTAAPEFITGRLMESMTNNFDRMKVSGLGRLRLRAPPSGGVFAIGVRGVAQPIPVTYQIPYGVKFAGGYKTYAVRPSRLDVSNRPRERWWGEYSNRQYPPLAWEWRSMLVARRFRLSYSRRQDLAAPVQMDEHQLISGIITQLRVWMRRAHKNLIKSWMAPQGRWFIAATSNLKRIPTKSRVNKRKLPEDWMAPQGRRFIAATSNLKRTTKSRVNKRKLPEDFLNVV